MIHALTFLCALAGFAALALSMDRHQREILRHPLPRRGSLALRALCFGLLLLALVPACRGLGPALGATVWSGHLSLAAASLFILLLRWRQRAGG